jgi:hypothetical protein
MRTSADAFPAVGGNARTERKRCKAKQGRRGKTALTCESWSYSSTVLGSRPEREKNYLVTIAARCYPIIAQGSDCGHWSRTEIARHRSAVAALEGFVDKTRSGFVHHV